MLQKLMIVELVKHLELLRPSPVTCTVAFNSNGGTAVPRQRVKKGEKATQPSPAPTKTGYTFTEWDKNNVAYNFNTPVTTNFVLDAKWTINSYTVEFDTDGGSEVEDQTVNYGGKVTKPEDPTKDGYTFDNWYTDDTFATVFDFTNTTISADTTIYAKFLENFTVTFNSDGGSSVDAQTVPDGGTATEPDPAPTKADYTFGEWQLSGVAYDFTTPVTEDITLVATWTPAG